MLISNRSLLRITYLICLLFAASPLIACEDESYRQFDFWLGTWDVKYTNSKDDKIIGTNRISQQLNNCIIHEHYQATSGFEGKSLNIYDKTTNRWHQTWTDNTGLLLQLDGSLVKSAENGDEMVLWGEGLDQSGRHIQHRIIWRQLNKDSVQQRWQVSHDQGLNWQMLFDGTYYRQPSTQTN